MNVLLTSVGRRSYIVNYFKEALNGTGKVHASNSEWTTALEEADYAVITPLIYEYGYIDFLIAYCKKNQIKVIISLFDIDLPVLAEHKTRLNEECIDVIVSDYEVTQICNDKWKSYQFISDIGLKAPKTFISLEKAQQAVHEGALEFPVMTKPRWGMGSISIFKAENQKELEVFYTKVKREVHESYLRYESKADPEHSVIIQEYLKGQEYGLDIINDLEKNHVVTFVKRKTEMRAGETEGAVTVKNELLEETGRKIANSLAHIANLDTDCFIVDGKAYILEMNCRFGGGYPFSHLAGANLPKAILAWLSGNEVDLFFSNYKIGIEGKKSLSIKKITTKE